TETMDMGPMGKYHMFGRQWPMGGMMNKPKEIAHVPNHWLLYFNVPDVKAASEKVKAKGGQVLNTMEVPGGDWISQCMDPQGGVFPGPHSKKPWLRRLPVIWERKGLGACSIPLLSYSRPSPLREPAEIGFSTHFCFVDLTGVGNDHRAPLIRDG